MTQKAKRDLLYGLLGGVGAVLVMRTSYRFENYPAIELAVIVIGLTLVAFCLRGIYLSVKSK
jgi:hypothetical protein